MKRCANGWRCDPFTVLGNTGEADLEVKITHSILVVESLRCLTHSSKRTLSIEHKRLQLKREIWPGDTYLVMEAEKQKMSKENDIVMRRENGLEARPRDTLMFNIWQKNLILPPFFLS